MLARNLIESGDNISVVAAIDLIKSIFSRRMTGSLIKEYFEDLKLSLDISQNFLLKVLICLTKFRLLSRKRIWTVWSQLEFDCATSSSYNSLQDFVELVQLLILRGIIALDDESLIARLQQIYDLLKTCADSNDAKSCWIVFTLLPLTGIMAIEEDVFTKLYSRLIDGITIPVDESDLQHLLAVYSNLQLAETDQVIIFKFYN